MREQIRESTSAYDSRNWESTIPSVDICQEERNAWLNVVGITFYNIQRHDMQLVLFLRAQCMLAPWPLLGLTQSTLSAISRLIQDSGDPEQQGMLHLTGLY